MKLERETRRLIKVKEWELNLYQPSTGVIPGTEVMVCTDKNGFIKTGNQPVDGQYICILGDSFAECIRLPEENRFPSVSERFLRSHGHNVNILNGAMSGANTLQLIFTLLIKCVPLNISLVIFVVPSIDRTISELKDGYFNKCKNVSLFYNTQEPVKHLNPDFQGSKYKEVLLLFNTCKIFNIRIIIATHPYKKDKDSRDDMNKIVIELANKKVFL